MKTTPRNLERRAEILHVARLVLMERGAEGFTIDETAQLARASKATLYRWWGGKAALLQEAMAAKDNQIGHDTGSLLGDLRGLIRGVADAQPTAGRILLGIALAMQDDPALARSWRENGFRGAAKMAAILDRAVARGELSGRPDIQALNTVIPGTLIWHFAVERGADAHVFADRFVDTVLLPAFAPWITEQAKLSA